MKCHSLMSTPILLTGGGGASALQPVLSLCDNAFSLRPFLSACTTSPRRRCCDAEWRGAWRLWSRGGFRSLTLHRSRRDPTSLPGVKLCMMSTCIASHRPVISF
jgi:hypothetical protein